MKCPSSYEQALKQYFFLSSTVGSLVNTMHIANVSANVISVRFVEGVLHNRQCSFLIFQHSAA